jgi:mycothiol synthase
VRQVIETRTVLAASDAQAVRALAAQAAQVDGVAPLSEQTLLRLDDPQAKVLHLVARTAGAPSAEGLVAYAQQDISEPASGAAELVVNPAARRRGLATQLAHRLAGTDGGRSVTIWAHGDLPAAAALAERLGFARSRVLLQLRRSLGERLPDPRWPEGVRVRTFVPGQDEQAWLAVNNAAFASHPEQGRWTLRDVEQREASDWFDPDGIFLAERAGALIGFHWTKVHLDENPPIGEVYIVGVRPHDSGQGIGPALTLAGLHHLRERGLDQVMLYVDEDNQPAVKTYERIGFTRFAADVLYASRS